MLDPLPEVEVDRVVKDVDIQWVEEIDIEAPKQEEAFAYKVDQYKAKTDEYAYKMDEYRAKTDGWVEKMEEYKAKITGGTNAKATEGHEETGAGGRETLRPDQESGDE